MKLGMISYNEICTNEDEGTLDKKGLYLIRGPRGVVYGPDARQQVGLEVKKQWERLCNILPSLDTVVIYVGDEGGEYAIEFAAEHKLEANKVVFVLCECNNEEKHSLIRKHGFSSSSIIECECGGRGTMAYIAKKFLETGQLDI